MPLGKLLSFAYAPPTGPHQAQTPLRTLPCSFATGNLAIQEGAPTPPLSVIDRGRQPGWPTTTTLNFAFGHWGELSARIRFPCSTRAWTTSRPNRGRAQRLRPGARVRPTRSRRDKKQAAIFDGAHAWCRPTRRATPGHRAARVAAASSPSCVAGAGLIASSTAHLLSRGPPAGSTASSGRSVRPRAGPQPTAACRLLQNHGPPVAAFTGDGLCPFRLRALPEGGSLGLAGNPRRSGGLASANEATPADCAVSALAAGSFACSSALWALSPR